MRHARPVLLALVAFTSALSTPARAADPDRKNPVRIFDRKTVGPSFRPLYPCPDGTLLVQFGPDAPGNKVEYHWIDPKTGKVARYFGTVQSNRTDPPLLVATSVKTFRLLDRTAQPSAQVIDHKWDNDFRAGAKADAGDFTHLTTSTRAGELRLTRFEGEAVVTCTLAKGKRADEVRYATPLPPDPIPSFPAGSDWCVIASHTSFIPTVKRRYETVLIDLADAKAKPISLVLDAPISAVAYAGDYLLLGTESGTLYRYDIKAQAVKSIPLPAKQRLKSIVFDPASKSAFAGSFDTKAARPNLFRIDVEKAVLVSEFVLADSFIHTVLLLDDMKTLAVVSELSSYLYMNWVPISDFKPVEK